MKYQELRKNLLNLAGDNDLRIANFQWDFIDGVFKDDEVRLGLFSAGRGSGKSTLCALIVASYLLSKQKQSIFLFSGVHAQSRIVHEMTCELLDIPTSQHIKSSQWKSCVSHIRTEITNNKTGSHLKAMSGEAKTALGFLPSLQIADECANWQEPSGENLFRSISSSVVKRPDSKALLISTQAESPQHWFSKLLNDKDPSIFARCYSYTGKDWKGNLEEALKKANPGLLEKNPFPDMKGLLSEARRAIADPTQEGSFSHFHLNSGARKDATSYLLAPEVFEQSVSEEVERGSEYVLGIDLGENLSLTSACAYWWKTGRLESFSCLPTTPSIQERDKQGNHQGALILAYAQNELMTAGESVIDIDAFLATCFERWDDPALVIADSWRFPSVRDALVRSGRGHVPIEKYAMGKAIFGDIQLTRRAFFEGKVNPAPNGLLTMSLRDSVTKIHSDGSETIEKVRGGRYLLNDPSSAMVLAVSAGRKIATANELRGEPMEPILVRRFG